MACHLKPTFRTALSAVDRSRGYFLGRALQRAPSRDTAARLGRALCGFDDPFNPLRPASVTFSIFVRVHNSNFYLDDEWQFTLSGPLGFTPAVFDWDGQGSNDTTYGPFIGPPGAYSLTGGITANNDNGNLFEIVVSATGQGTLATEEVGEGGPSINFTLPA